MLIGLSMASPEQIAQIAKFRALGYTQQEIADEVGLSRQAVAYQLLRLKNKSKIEGEIEVLVTALMGAPNIKDYFHRFNLVLNNEDIKNVILSKIPDLFTSVNSSHNEKFWTYLLDELEKRR